MLSGIPAASSACAIGGAGQQLSMSITAPVTRQMRVRSWAGRTLAANSGNSAAIHRTLERLPDRISREL